MSKPVPTSLPVMVTGASSGIGEEFARRFAQRGHPLTIVARRADRLEALADELRRMYGAEVTVLPADLETAKGRGAVAKVLRQPGACVLVNNAGYGTRGAVAGLDPARERGEVQVNVVALHELTLAALPGLVEARTGGIINMGSTAAFQPLPYMATYSGTKAFVLHFSEALAEELRGTGVRITAVCPGPVRTEFDEISGVNGSLNFLRPLSTEKCVAAALHAFDRGHVVSVPGPINLALAQSPRLAPRALVRRVTKPMLAPR